MNIKMFPLLFSTLFLVACNGQSNEITGITREQNSKEEIVASTNSKNSKTESQSRFLNDYLKSEWLTVLPEQSWNDIEKENGSYYYSFKEETSGTSKINKSVKYNKTVNGDYQGSMSVNFSGQENSKVLHIPKSFASHVDKLVFSTAPSKVINPDPIVEFEKESGDIDIQSSESKSLENVESNLEEQIFEAESKRCESLEGDERMACSLSLIAKYRNSEGLREEITKLNMNDLAGASIVAVFNNDIRTCDYISDRKDRERCYEYSYQIMVDECHVKEGKNYRDCVRTLSSKLPSFKEQRLFCGHIDDEQMRNECQGVASVGSCDEIEDIEMRDRCKLNIARTKGNIEVCDKVENTDYKQVCVGIIGIANDDEVFCDKIDDDYIAGQCRAKIAMQKNNRAICDDIKDEDSQDICYGYFIMKQDVNENMCSNINELFLKEMCEMVLAVQNGAVEKCMDPTFISIDNRVICLAGIGIKHGNAELCDMIDVVDGEFEEDRLLRGKIRDLCFVGAAQKNKDPELCNEITTTSVKKDCEEKASNLEVDNNVSQNNEAQGIKESSVKMSCSQVDPAICPMDNQANNGATIHIGDNGHDVQCTYHKLREAGYPLYNEVYKLGNKRDGSYKQYDKSGNLQIFSEHVDGRNDGFRIECSATGALDYCQYYQPGSKTINCL